MKKVIEALQTTMNIESYDKRINDKVKATITKLDIQGKRFLIEYSTNGNLISSTIVTAEEAKEL